MRRTPEVHTVHNSGGGCANKVAGDIVSQHRTKDTAVECGRQIARDLEMEQAIHNLDGQIGRKNSCGNDPNPPSDKNR